MIHFVTQILDDDFANRLARFARVANMFHDLLGKLSWESLQVNSTNKLAAECCDIPARAKTV
jgi:hypothetical protein